MTTPSLSTVQRRLAADILRHAAGGDDAGGDLVAMLRLPDATDAETRLDVYRNGYPARILEALREAYPAIANICGEGSFANLTRRYLRERDVSRTSLNDIGRQLPEYCAVDPLATTLPFLADLAHLEWAVLLAFHSHQQEPVDAAAFAAWDMADWERAVFSWQPSLAVVRSQWPINDLWQSRHRQRAEIDIDLTDRPQTVVVHRRGDDVDCELLSAAQAVVLESLLRGALLGAAMENLAKIDGAADEAAAMFSDWLGAGWITGARLASNT